MKTRILLFEASYARQTAVKFDLVLYTYPLIQVGQPRIYDCVGSSSSDKYSAGFVAFSKQMRPKGNVLMNSLLLMHKTMNEKN